MKTACTVSGGRWGRCCRHCLGAAAGSLTPARRRRGLERGRPLDICLPVVRRAPGGRPGPQPDQVQDSYLITAARFLGGAGAAARERSCCKRGPGRAASASFEYNLPWRQQLRPKAGGLARSRRKGRAGQPDSRLSVPSSGRLTFRASELSGQLRKGQPARGGSRTSQRLQHCAGPLPHSCIRPLSLVSPSSGCRASVPGPPRSPSLRPAKPPHRCAGPRPSA